MAPYERKRSWKRRIEKLAPSRRRISARRRWISRVPSQYITAAPGYMLLRMASPRAAAQLMNAWSS